MPTALAVFIARVEARAILFGTSEYADMGQAIAPLLDAAFRDGLTERLGEPALLQMIERIFAPFLEPP